LRIDDHLHALTLHDLVPRLHVGKAHAVLHPRTPAVLHKDAQPLGGVILLRKHDLKLADGWFCDNDHRETRYQRNVKVESDK